MTWPTVRRRLARSLRWGIALAVLAGLGAGAWRVRVWTRPREAPLPLGRVSRADVELTLIVGGEIEGSRSTVVECELQDLAGPDGRPGGGMTIIELIPDGQDVRKGDVLCRFDASNYVELARRQQIELQRAIAEERQAEFERDAAEAALRAYRDGESHQIVEELQAKIALAQADLRKADERLAWTRRMQAIGYVASDEVANSETARRRLEVELGNQRRALYAHRSFTVPKVVRELEVAVENARTRLEFGREQREAEQSRLEKLEGLVEKCTVRAPHDGIAIHANIFYRTRMDSSETFLREGARIIQGQPLFILPDLAHPIVQLVLHESISPQVRIGMPARIKVPALPGRELHGRVQSVSPLPTDQWRAYQEYKGVEARIAIDDPPPRLLPSFSAEVTIVTGERPNALVVPTDAVAVEDGRPVCYVAGTLGVERRPVSLAPADRRRTEILSGLEEGELIVLDPERFRTAPDGTLDPFPEPEPARPEATAVKSALPALPVRPS